MRQYINLVEAVQKGCPIATHDITLNLNTNNTPYNGNTFEK